jgi:hypothetical protein
MTLAPRFMGKSVFDVLRSTGAEHLHHNIVSIAVL